MDLIRVSVKIRENGHAESKYREQVLERMFVALLDIPVNPVSWSKPCPIIRTTVDDGWSCLPPSCHGICCKGSLYPALYTFHAHWVDGQQL
ncbi:hypothetical protein WMY93_027327 [Mugilogobius chulae]|uniref:Uncharacterized protein n=1 Tax=Mugilogobius chulae TaxID=88201 RepID=A0AAW0MZE1_9GOBI